MLISCGINLNLHIWNSYVRDYQLQGRYIISMIVLFGYVVAYEMDKIIPAIKKGTIKKSTYGAPTVALTIIWMILFSWSALGTMVKMCKQVKENSMKLRHIHFSTKAELMLILAAAWICAAFIYFFLPNAVLVFPITGCTSFILMVAWAAKKRTDTALKLCFRYRWILALLVFLMCLCMRLHGSSIGVYDEIFPTHLVGKTSALFGKPRWIRSDEFGVATPAFFSQAANHHRLYSHQMSLSPMNMVLNYYSPVWDWTIIGKPLSWGFLLFGNEVGLSWYWCMEIILLFMMAFEMCLILTGRRLSALLGAIMVTFSPAIQWWFMPHMPLVILYSMSAFCSVYWLFTASSPLFRWISAGLFLITGLGFVLSLFPSFQVPCAYTVLILLAVCLWRDREKIRFTRREWLCILLPTAILLLILCRFFLFSKEDISLLLNTIYPGRRVSLGGDRRIYDLFTDLTSFFLPYQDVSFSNNSEASTYIHFAPFFFLLSPYLLPTLKKMHDKSWIAGSALWGILLVQIVYMSIGFPQWLADITLLRFCNRMYAVYGWIATLFTIWGLDVLMQNPNLLSQKVKFFLPPLYGCICLLTLDEPRMKFFSSFTFQGIPLHKFLIFLTVLGIVCTLYFAIFQKNRLLIASVTLAMLFCGATVNPLMRGIDPVVDHPISKTVAQIAETEPESRWLCTDSVFIIPNFLMANGAKVLNATNFYPDFEKWAILDSSKQYEDIYNRYANQCTELTEDDNSVELLHPDSIKILINPETLKVLGIRYLFSSIDHTELLSKYGITCAYVTGHDGYGIYRLEYLSE